MSYQQDIGTGKDLREKSELKLPPPFKSVAALLCEKQWSTIIHLYRRANSVRNDENV